jgi:hypothetical protein
MILDGYPSFRIRINFLIPDPGTRGQKSTGSQIWNRNIAMDASHRRDAGNGRNTSNNGDSNIVKGGVFFYRQEQKSSIMKGEKKMSEYI